MPDCEAAIAIPTFRRAEGLAQLLDSLEPSLAAHRAAILVGDNGCDDPVHGPATRAVVDGFAARGHAITYLPVRDRGISQNRNALLAAYRAGQGCGGTPAPWLGMLDDDLTAPPQWLSAMLSTGIACDADAVGAHYAIDVSHRRPGLLVRNSVLVRRPDHATGPIEVFHAGGNCLFSRRLLLAEPMLWFDTRLGRSGGEDLDFLDRAHARRARFAWAAEARCIENFPIERASAGYIFGRYYSTGNSMAHIALARHGRRDVLARVLRRLAGSIGRAGLRLARADLDGAVARAFDATWAIGGLSGALGLGRSERYR